MVALRSRGQSGRSSANFTVQVPWARATNRVPSSVTFSTRMDTTADRFVIASIVAVARQVPPDTGLR